MITQEQIADRIEIPGHVRTTHGDDLGPMERLFVDGATGRPSWISVTVAAHGGAALIPLSGATLDGQDLRVPYHRTLVEDSPRMPDDGSLDPDHEERLRRHYGLDLAAGADTDTDADADADADAVLTRSEEQLRVGTETRESGTVRIHKYIVTETVTETIPVRREEIRIEQLPVEDAGEATVAGQGVVRIGTPFEEGDYEVVLYEERPIVELEIVAVERITLTKETITNEETISGQVRKEVMEATER